MIREKLGWSKEQCHAHNLPLDVQPIGASGSPLGAIALVSLPIEVEETGASELIPCYVLDSSKPIWQGEVRNCSVILGTNALTSLGFTVTHIDGTVVSPVESKAEAEQESMFCVTLQQSLRLDPYQTRSTDVSLSDEVTTNTMQTCVVSY